MASNVEIYNQDIIEWCKSYDGPQFHAVLCDPPYELGFMGKQWDSTGIAFRPETWEAIGQHMLPGAFGMAFASARGWHRMACAIEDAGFVFHPTIFLLWTYGSGFPKATRIDTQIDKAAGAEREAGITRRAATKIMEYRPWNDRPSGSEFTETLPATPLAAAWAGHRYGLQALKPAAEPIIVFQKPYSGKPVDCITTTGAGALNIYGGRIGTGGGTRNGTFPNEKSVGVHGDGLNGACEIEQLTAGRWPANLALDSTTAETLGDAGRFFFQAQWSQIDDADPCLYQAKASRRERDAGCDGFEAKKRPGVFDDDNYEWKSDTHGHVVASPARNPHPTVKPVALASWLATLLLPPTEYAPRRIVIPFSGSGSECIGAVKSGWEEIVGIEQEQEHCEIARARIAYWQEQWNAESIQLKLPF